MGSDGNSKFAEQAEKARLKMIVGMAIDFAGMTRVFAEGSNTKIFLKLEELLVDLHRVSTREEYDPGADEFAGTFQLSLVLANSNLIQPLCVA